MDDGQHTDDGTTGRTGHSRRRFMAASALVGAGAFGAAGPVGTAAAHGGEDGKSKDNGDSDGEFEDDIAILNYARTLEFLEAEFYQRGLDNISCSDLLDAKSFEDFGPAIRTRVYDDLQVIRDHEQTHAEVIGDTIEDLGGDPVEKPEFDFGTAVEDPDEFITLGAQLEDVGVSAYNGVIGDINSSDLVTAGATIATVEGRHASFLRVLNGEIGFPNAFDPTRSQEEVLDIAGQFIVE